MVRKILIGASVVIVVLVVVIALQPATFHVERSVVIAAPRERAFSQVADFHQWATWSPFEKLDPDMKKTYTGAPSGVGAIYAWAGNGKAGEGRMTIEESTPSKIGIKLEFLKPFEATNGATFSFAPTGAGTKVTWAMDGNNNFISKAFHLVMNMDKLIGGDFERGLAAMKANAERSPAIPGASAAAN